MLEFSNIPGLTKIFNKDDWKKVFHACAELPNYRETKYSSYFVTEDAETRASKLYYEKNPLEKGGYSYDPASHTALTHDDFAAGMTYEFGKYYMCSSADTNYTTIATSGSTQVFENGYFYSKANPYQAMSGNALSPSEDANQCGKSTLYYLTGQVVCSYSNSEKFLEGVRYAWDTGDGQGVKECTTGSNNWANRTYSLNSTISSVIGSSTSRVVYALPTYLSAKGVTTIYRYPIIGTNQFASNLTYKRKLATYSYKTSEAAAIEFEETTDEYYRAGRYYYKKSGSTYVYQSTTPGNPVSDTVKYVAKRYFTKNTEYALVSTNEYFSGSTAYFMYTGTGVVTATKDSEYTEGGVPPVNSFYKKSDVGTTDLYFEVSEAVKKNYYTSGQSPATLGLYERNERTGFIFCAPIGKTAAGTYIDNYFLYRNGNHLYYTDDSTTFYLISDTTGVLSSVTYLTEGAKTWNYQIQTATDLYFKRSHTYYTDQDVSQDLITGELDLESNVRVMIAGTDYEIGASIASWKSSHTGQNIYQHLTNFYIPTPNFVGQITHGMTLYERAGTNFPYEGFVAVATETGSDQARGALYRCKRREYELTEDNHHHYTGEYPSEESKTYYEYNSSTGEYTARGGDNGKIYRNYDGSSFNQVTMDYVFDGSTVYFKNSACEESDKLVADEDYIVGGNIADWVAAEAGRSTPYVTNRTFYYRSGWTFTPITGNRYGVTTDARFTKGKEYYWYSGSGYEFSRVTTNNTVDMVHTRAVIEDTVFGYHNEENDIFWGYTTLVQGTDWTAEEDIADWIASHESLFPVSTSKCLYSTTNTYATTTDTSLRSGMTDEEWEAFESEGSTTTKYYKKSGTTYTQMTVRYDEDDDTYYFGDTEWEDPWGEDLNPNSLGCYEVAGTIIDTTQIKTGEFDANKQYSYRNFNHITEAAAGSTDVVTKLYRFINQDQKIEEDASGNAIPVTITQAEIGTVVPYKVYTRYWDTQTKLPKYYYISDIDNVSWDKKFSIFDWDDSEVFSGKTALVASSAGDPHYWYRNIDSSTRVFSYKVIECAVGDNLEVYGTVYSKQPTFTYIGRAISSQSKIIYIDPTEEINIAFNNLGTMITEIPICISYEVTGGYNYRGGNDYGNGEEIPSSPRIYLESKNGEEILPDEYYEEVYGSYYWDQFFLDHSISANPIEDVVAYYMDGSYLYMKWKDPTIMIPSSDIDTDGSPIIDADSPPDAWNRTTITITDTTGNDAVVLYTETTCNEFNNDFLRLTMDSSAAAGTTERELYDRIQVGCIIHLTAISQTGTYTTYHIKPSKIVWTHTPKTYVSLTANGKALPDVTYYDYDSWKKDGSFVEMINIYPYYTDVKVNEVGGVICRFSRDFPAYIASGDPPNLDEIKPVIVGDTGASVGDVIQSLTTATYYTAYHATPEITWSELTQLGFFDQLCSAGYEDVTESGVQRHASTEVNVRTKSVGSEISIPWYNGSDTRSGKGYAKIMDTNAVIPARDIEMGYKPTEDTEPDSTKTYYTRKCVSLTACLAGASSSGDQYDYEPWIADDDNFGILIAAGKLYEHDTSFPHRQYFLKKTAVYKASVDTTIETTKTYYDRTGGQVVDGETIDSYLHPLVYTEHIFAHTTDNPSELGLYEKTSYPSYDYYEKVDLKDPNWIMVLKDPRNRSIFVKYPNGSSPYYEQVPNKEYSATFRLKICLKDGVAFDTDLDKRGHLWGALKDDGTYDESEVRALLNGSNWGFTAESDWLKFFNEAVSEVINPVVVDRYVTQYNYEYSTDTHFLSGKTYYTLGDTAGTYVPMTSGEDYDVGDPIGYTLTTDTTIDSSKTYYRFNEVKGVYVQITKNVSYVLCPSTETTVDASKSYFVYNEESGDYDAVTPAGTENPYEEGWYYSVTVTSPMAAGWYCRDDVYERYESTAPISGSLITSQTLDKFWLPSLSQMDVSKVAHPVSGDAVLVPSEGSPLYYYQTKINSYGNIYKFLVAMNASGAPVDWWCRTAVQNDIGASEEENLEVGPYVTSNGTIDNDGADDTLYIFPFFTIA